MISNKSHCKLINPSGEVRAGVSALGVFSFVARKAHTWNIVCFMKSLYHKEEQ